MQSTRVLAQFYTLLIIYVLQYKFVVYKINRLDGINLLSSSVETVTVSLLSPIPIIVLACTYTEYSVNLLRPVTIPLVSVALVSTVLKEFCPSLVT